MDYKLIPDIDPYIKFIIDNQIVKTSNSDDCYLWIGCCRNDRPTIKINKSMYLVSRIIYKLYYNVDPKELLVLHTRLEGGHNFKCLNPKHLYLGNQSENIKDSIIDGTFINNNLQYSSEIIKQIRLLWNTGKYTQQELANLFNMSRRNVSYIVNYETRK